MVEPIGTAGRAALLLSHRLWRRWLRRSIVGALARPDPAVFGEGAALAPDPRARLEAFLGRDLSDVRTFTGERVQEMGTALAAEAFTVGSSVFLPRPADSENLPLLAHELTHVVQQQRPSLIPAAGPPGPMPQAREAPGAFHRVTAAVVGTDAQADVVPHLAVTLQDGGISEQPPHPQLSLEGPDDTGESSEAQARAAEAAVARSAAPQGSAAIDATQVADRVYRLMRDDLLIERERHSAMQR